MFGNEHNLSPVLCSQVCTPTLNISNQLVAPSAFKPTRVPTRIPLHPAHSIRHRDGEDRTLEADVLGEMAEWLQEASS